MTPRDPFDIVTGPGPDEDDEPTDADIEEWIVEDAIAADEDAEPDENDMIDEDDEPDLFDEDDNDG